MAAGGSNIVLNNVTPGANAFVETQSKEDSGANKTVVNKDLGTLESSEPQNACESRKPKSNSHDLSSPQAFDTRMDDLVEFEETTLPDNMSQMSIAEALYKLEANKDIPSIQLIKYDGNPLTYVEFIERFNY